MYSKVLMIAATLAVATAQYGGYGHGYRQGSHSIVQHQPQVIAHQPAVVLQHQPAHYAAPVQQDYHTPAHYSFDYGVQDPHTGDIKSQHESREGDVVRGEYSLHEADGTVRRVEYSVDPHSGFNAVVHREGHASHQAPNYQH